MLMVSRLSGDWNIVRWMSVAAAVAFSLSGVARGLSVELEPCFEPVQEVGKAQLATRLVFRTFLRERAETVVLKGSELEKGFGLKIWTRDGGYLTRDEDALREQVPREFRRLEEVPLYRSGGTSWGDGDTRYIVTARPEQYRFDDPGVYYIEYAHPWPEDEPQPMQSRTVLIAAVVTGERRNELEAITSGDPELAQLCYAFRMNPADSAATRYDRYPLWKELYKRFPLSAGAGRDMVLYLLGQPDDAGFKDGDRASGDETWTYTLAPHGGLSFRFSEAGLVDYTHGFDNAIDGVSAGETADWLLYTVGEPEETRRYREPREGGFDAFWVYHGGRSRVWLLDGKVVKAIFFMGDPPRHIVVNEAIPDDIPD